MIPVYLSYQLLLYVETRIDVNIVSDTMQPKSSDASHLYRPGMWVVCHVNVEVIDRV